MATYLRIRCLCCGVARHTKHFGVFDGVFVPEQHPQHVIEQMVTTIGGRGYTPVNERSDLPIVLAKALRDSMRASLARLEHEIEAAEGGAEEDAA